MRQQIIDDIEAGVIRAYDKHGPMTHDQGKQLAILVEELGEAGEAYLDDDIAHYKEEVLDLIAAAVRVYDTLPEK